MPVGLAVTIEEAGHIEFFPSRFVLESLGWEDFAVEAGMSREPEGTHGMCDLVVRCLRQRKSRRIVTKYPQI